MDSPDSGEPKDDDVATAAAKGPRGRARLPVLVGLLIMAVIAAGIAFTGLRFRQEREKGPVTAGPQVTDGVLLDVVVVSIDPIKSEMTLRLTPIPVGNYGSLGFEKPVNILTGTSIGITEREIEAGTPITPVDVTTSLLDSQVATYPFDRYKAELSVVIAASVGPDGEPVAPTGGGEAPPGTTLIAVPTGLRVESALHGYKITARPALEQTTEFGGEASVADTLFDVRRSGSTRFFAVFVMVLMWAISIGVLWITLSVLFRRRRFEVALLSVFGIVLFALPNIRNVQPNAPPIGSLTDILAFFWCESLVAACLVAMIVVFVRRGPDPPPAAPSFSQPERPGNGAASAAGTGGQ